VDQGGGLAQPRGQEQAEDMAVGELQLGVWRQVAVDDAGDVELIEQGLDQRQGPQIHDFLGAGSTMPGERHGSSVREKASGDVERNVQRSEFGAAPYSTHGIKEEEKSQQSAMAAGRRIIRADQSDNPSAD